MPRKQQGSQSQPQQQASQSQRKGKRVLEEHDEDDDGEYENGSQQASQSKSSARMTPEEERKGVNRIVKLMLCKDENKRAVSRSEILTALKGEGVSSGQANVNMLIESAKKRFKHVFGFDLVEGSKSELYADAVFSQASQVILLFSSEIFVSASPFNFLTSS